MVEMENQAVSGATVTAGGSDNFGEVNPEGESEVQFSYHIESGGSPEARLQLYVGDDTNGNPQWATVETSASMTDTFVLDRRVKKARVQIAETGATTDLTGVSVWHYFDDER